MRYRLHPGNIVGSNVGFLNHARRLNMISKRRFSRWMDLNTEALKPIEPHMTGENRRVFRMLLTPANGACSDARWACCGPEFIARRRWAISD